MASEPKNAEFARLLNFFERLASYKSRFHNRIDYDASIGEMDTIPLPADLAPVINSLTDLVNNRFHDADARQQKTNGRKRSHTIATAPHIHRDIDLGGADEESIAKFPLGKKYRFTFRLMLHKLYQIDDWRQKVKEVLERSQNEYRPLSETIAAAQAEKRTEEEEERKQDGHVHFKAGTPVSSRKSGVRSRANSTLCLGKIRERKSSIIHLKSPKSPTMAMKNCPPAEEDVQVLKKRCIGRRKSLSGPLSNGGGRVGGSWIYDAEVVSVAEIAKRGEAPKYQETSFVCSPCQGANLVVARPGKKLDSGLAGMRRASSVMDNMTPLQMLRKRPLEL